MFLSEYFEILICIFQSLKIIYKARCVLTLRLLQQSSEGSEAHGGHQAVCDEEQEEF